MFVWIRTRECIDVNDCVLARLVVNDDVNAEERNPQRFPQGFTKLPDDIIIRWLGYTFHIVSLLKRNTSNHLWASTTEKHPKRNAYLQMWGQTMTLAWTHCGYWRKLLFYLQNMKNIFCVSAQKATRQQHRPAAQITDSWALGVPGKQGKGGERERKERESERGRKTKILCQEDAEIYRPHSNSNKKRLIYTETAIYYLAFLFSADTKPQAHVYGAHLLILKDPLAN